MNVRFSPAGKQRIQDYRSDLAKRVRAGSLSEGEANILAAFAVKFEAAGTCDRVKCPACGEILRLVGQGQQFACSCSPGVERSVWDNRL